MADSNRKWLSSPVDLTLSQDEVHVWRADLDLPAARLQQLVQSLSADEQVRAERFYFEQHRQRFIAGRGILRILLGRYLSVEPQQLRFDYTSSGKPALAKTGDSRLQFNLSHSQGLALYAVTRDRQIGIDLEQLRPTADVEQIAQRFFSAQEYAAIQSLPPDQKLEAFFRYWTCKEAYLKATGDGLSQLERIEVEIIPGEPVKLLRILEDLPQDWTSKS